MSALRHESPRDKSPPLSFSRLPGDALVELKDVSFGYTKDRQILSGVTLTTEGDKVNIREVVMGDLVQTGKTPSAVAFGLHGMDVDAAKKAPPWPGSEITWVHKSTLTASAASVPEARPNQPAAGVAFFQNMPTMKVANKGALNIENSCCK